MRTERRTHPLGRLVLLLTAVLLCFGTSLSTAPAAMAKDDPKWHVDYGPDDSKDCPEDWQGECGVDKQGNYCEYREIDDNDICPFPEAGQGRGTIGECENAGGEKSPECSDEDW